MSDQEVEVFLEHFGVKGMRWGVRNERKIFSSTDMSKKISILKNHRSTKVGSAEGGALLLLYGGMLLGTLASQKIPIYRDSGRKEARKTGKKEFKMNSDLAKKMSVSKLYNKVVAPINPNYGEPGTRMNCRRATMAYEMRRRGYDVKATKSNFASGQTIKGLKNAVGVGKTTKPESAWGEKQISDSKTLRASTPQKKAELVFSSLANNPNGSRGELGVGWTMGGGHSMAWEVVNRKPVIFDAQNGKIYDNVKYFAEFTPVVHTAAQTRLDNKPINKEFIKRWVTDV